MAYDSPEAAATVEAREPAEVARPESDIPHPERLDTEGLFDYEQLDPEEPFEIDHQRAHLYSHAGLGEDDLYDVWAGDRIYYEAHPPAHWLLVAEVPGGEVLVVPLCPGAMPTKARPIGVYLAPRGSRVEKQYRADRRALYG